jgi:hypothetical protein
MKKVVIGCLIVLVVLAAGAAAGSYALYHKVRAGAGKFAALATVRDLERSVRNQASYSPPASGELTPAQVQCVLQVQQAVRARLGARASDLERKYHEYFEKKEASVLDLPALVSAYGDLASGYVDAKRAQVDALNAAGRSLAEYRWARSQMYRAIGLRVVDVDVGGIIDDLRSGRTPAVPAIPVAPVGPTGPKRNQDLVASHRKALEDNVALAFFGL